MPANINYYILLLFVVGGVLASYNRDVCYADVKQMIENKTLAKDDPSFARDKSGAPMSDINNPVLTWTGCGKICGKGAGWYDDIGERLGVCGSSSHS